MDPLNMKLALSAADMSQDEMSLLNNVMLGLRPTEKRPEKSGIPEMHHSDIVNAKTSWTA